MLSTGRPRSLLPPSGMYDITALDVLVYSIRRTCPNHVQRRLAIRVVIGGCPVGKPFFDPTIHPLPALESLPNELQRNFLLMRDLDTKAQQLMRGIDLQEEDFVKKYINMAADKRTDQMNKIRQQFDKAKEYADDKVHLAIQTYELVDKHIRRLDADLARFEAEIKEKNMLGSPQGGSAAEMEIKAGPSTQKGRTKGE
ncbi:unnamed protein product, partial [Cyprideis torosa]